MTRKAKAGGLFVGFRGTSAGSVAFHPDAQAIVGAEMSKRLAVLMAWPPKMPKVWRDEPCPMIWHVALPVRSAERWHALCRHCDGTGRILEPAV